MTSDTTKKRKLQAGIAIVALGTLIVGAAFVFPAKPMTGSQDTAKVTTTSTTHPSSTSVTAATYKDGTYSATGSYYSPGGQESLGVTVTLAKDIVTAANVQSEANDPTATSYQASFSSGYKSHVIGKNISSIKLSNVSGSSLTSQGFNNALEQIEQKAKA